MYVELHLLPKECSAVAIPVLRAKRTYAYEELLEGELRSNAIDYVGSDIDRAPTTITDQNAIANLDMLLRAALGKRGDCCYSCGL